MEKISLVKKALGMEREIIAFKFLAYKDEYVRSDAEPISSSLADIACKASLGKHFKINADSLKNVEDNYALGFSCPSWQVKSGYNDFIDGKFISYSVANNVAQARKYPNHQMYGAEIGPYQKVDSPDIIIFICKAKTVMRIMQGYVRYFGVAKNLLTTATDGIGMDLIARVFSNNDINYSLFNRQTRIEADFQAGEMGVSMPVNKLDLVLDGILETVNLTENNIPKKELLNRLTDPKELGFDIVMNYDYAVKASEYIDYCNKCQEDL